MALRFLDGFEQYGQSNGDAANLGIAYALSASGFTVVQGGRYGYGKCLRFTGSRNVTTPSLSTASTWIIGFAFRRPTGAAGDYTLCTIMEDGGTVEGINVQSMADGSLRVRRGTTNRSSSAAIISPDVWYYIELKVAIANSGGTYEVRVNGSNVVSDTDDTQAGSAGNADRVRISGQANIEFDNLYVCDGSGALNNDFAGEKIVKTLTPNAAGDETDWTPDSGTNYQRVDEIPPDGDTSYVSSDTPGETDLYNFEDVSGMSNIVGIMVSAVCRKTDVTDFDLHLPVKGSTQDDGPATTVSHSEYQAVSRVLVENVDTSDPWEVSEINNAQFGIKVG